MKKKTRNLLALALVAISLIINLCACGGGEGTLPTDVQSSNADVAADTTGAESVPDVVLAKHVQNMDGIPADPDIDSQAADGGSTEAIPEEEELAPGTHESGDSPAENEYSDAGVDIEKWLVDDPYLDGIEDFQLGEMLLEFWGFVAPSSYGYSYKTSDGDYTIHKKVVLTGAESNPHFRNSAEVTYWTSCGSYSVFIPLEYKTKEDGYCIIELMGFANSMPKEMPAAILKAVMECEKWLEGVR